MSCPKCQPKKKRLPLSWLISLVVLAVIAVLAYTAS